MDKIEKRILEIIDQKAEKIMDFGRDIWSHAELGFQEFRTSGKFCEVLDELGLPYENELAITGVKSYLKEKQEDEVRIALMGELDGLPYPNNPNANPETGATHFCGHDTQITGVMGAALALTDPEVKAALGGNVAFIGVPCEEGAAPEVQDKLMAEGKIHYLGGKCELIHIGAMDDIDITVGSHVNGYLGNEDGLKYGISNAPSMGFMQKYITYYGKAEHPGNSPIAIDALSAARLAMNAVDMQREGCNHWEYWDSHLLHGFIRNGGHKCNVVTDEVKVDYELRAKSIAALKDMSYRVDRSLRAGAVAVGAGMENRTEPGYLPYIPVKDTSIIEEVFDIVDPEHKHEIDMLGPDKMQGTTDYADLSYLMPVLQFYTAGHRGFCHDDHFCVADPYEYWVVPAKCFALMAYRLLKDDAQAAKKIIAENKPLMTSEDYRQLMTELRTVEKMDRVPVPSFE